MKYKMIISDYDGTLSDRNTLPKETADAIVKYKNAGGRFVLCSGRATPSADIVLSSLPVAPDAMITFQGADIRVDGKFVKKAGVKSEVLISIVKELLQYKKEFCFYTDDNLYYNVLDYPPMEYYKQFYPKTAVYVPDILQKLTEINGYVKKMNILKYPEEDVTKLQQIIKDKFSDKVLSNSGAPIIEEIIDKTCTKYTASKFVAEYFNVPESEVITIGDSTNDLMLLDYGFGIAVSGGSDALIKKAKYVAPDIKKMPVKHVIETVLAGKDFN